MRLSNGAPNFVEQALHAVPIVGAPLGALTNSQTYVDLKSISEEDGKTHDDVAAEVTTRFWAQQEKLHAYRAARVAEEWDQFTANPVSIGALTPLYLASTIFAAFVAYVLGYRRGATAWPEWFPQYADSLGLDGSSYHTLPRLGEGKYKTVKSTITGE